MRNITEMEIAKIKDFENCCNEMINGKIILSDIKLSKILKAIANSDEIYAYLKQCLLNFDYKTEFTKAKGADFTNNYFILPKEKHKIVALIFCILLDIDNKKINFLEFIAKYFKGVEDDEYKIFTQKIMIPFRDCILREFGLYQEPEFVDEVANMAMVNNREQINTSIQTMQNIVSLDIKIKPKQKNELLVILNALNEGLSIKKEVITSALEIALECKIGKNKNLKKEFEKLVNLINNYEKGGR